MCCLPWGATGGGGGAVALVTPRIRRGTRNGSVLPEGARRGAQLAATLLVVHAKVCTRHQPDTVLAQIPLGDPERHRRTGRKSSDQALHDVLRAGFVGAGQQN